MWVVCKLTNLRTRSWGWNEFLECISLCHYQCRHTEIFQLPTQPVLLNSRFREPLDPLPVTLPGSASLSVRLHGNRRRHKALVKLSLFRFILRCRLIQGEKGSRTSRWLFMEKAHFLIAMWGLHDGKISSIYPAGLLVESPLKNIL